MSVPDLFDLALRPIPLPPSDLSTEVTAFVRQLWWEAKTLLAYLGMCVSHAYCLSLFEPMADICGYEGRQTHVYISWISHSLHVI